MPNSAQPEKERTMTDPEKPDSVSVVDVMNQAIRKIVEDENMTMTFKILPCEKIFYEMVEVGRKLYPNRYGSSNNRYIKSVHQFKPLHYVKINYGRSDMYMLKSESDKMTTGLVCPIWYDEAMYHSRDHSRPHDRQTKVDVWLKKSDANIEPERKCSSCSWPVNSCSCPLTVNAEGFLTRNEVSILKNDPSTDPDNYEKITIEHVSKKSFEVVNTGDKNAVDFVHASIAGGSSNALINKVFNIKFEKLVNHHMTKRVSKAEKNSADEHDLEVTFCGISKLDVADWKKHTLYKNYSATDKTIQWFWLWLERCTEDEQSRLLQFVTGTCRITNGGFADLIGSNGPQRFCIEKTGNTDWLPKSHTCFNRLDLPAYPTYDELKEKLHFAINECSTRFGRE